MNTITWPQSKCNYCPRLTFYIYSHTDNLCTIWTSTSNPTAAFVWQGCTNISERKTMPGSTFADRLNADFRFSQIFQATLPQLVLKSQPPRPIPYPLTECPINNQHWPKETCNFRPCNHFYQMLCCPSQWFENLNDNGHFALTYLQAATKDSRDAIRHEKNSSRSLTSIWPLRNVKQSSTETTHPQNDTVNAAWREKTFRSYTD